MSSAPARWLVLRVHVADPELLPLAADLLIAEGSAGVQEEADALLAYLPECDDPETFVAGFRERLVDSLREAAEPRVSWSWRAHEDWARRWKDGLAPREITSRLVVKPSWTEWEPRRGQVVLDIDPQMAFGTGEHATTRGCLRLLDAALRAGDRVLDVGSGSAVLALAAVRLGAASAVAVEYDADANINARENIARNDPERRVRLVEARADGALLAELGSFDVVLANILSGVIRALLPALRRSLAPGGRVIVSGILRTEHRDVVRAAEAVGFRIARVDAEEEWWSALLEPVRPDDAAEPAPA